MKNNRLAAGMEPCWLIWEASADGGRPYLVAVDTSEEQANLHVRMKKEEARVLDRPPPMLRIEESWLDHLYGESMTKNFDEAKKMVKEVLRAQVAELRTRLRRAIALAREGFSRGWDKLDKKERLDELVALEKILP
jgi:hypothetical protein